MSPTAVPLAQIFEIKPGDAGWSSSMYEHDWNALSLIEVAWPHFAYEDPDIGLGM